MNNEWTKEEHPDWYRDIHPMRFLILGNFPPHHGKRHYPFYYPNTLNRFWKILADIAGVPLQWKKSDDPHLAVEERFQIMKKLKAGVQNLGLEIERKGKSALDTNIRITRFHDILSIINAHPELERILLAGYSAAHSTARSFLRYIQEAGFDPLPKQYIQPEGKFHLQLGTRIIECVVLNSTSTASRVSYDIVLAQFRKYLK